VSLYARLIALAVAVVLLAGIAWKLHHSGVVSGRAEVQQKWDAEKAKQLQDLAAANEAARAKEHALQVKAMEAINAASERAKKSQVAAAAARRAADSLRDDLAAARAQLPSASGDALRKHAATLNAVFGECAATAEGLAGQATGHASDTLTLEQAWPK
jgi:Skp family chaperone for outer membrane proteins